MDKQKSEPLQTKTAVIVISDLHINSTVSLAPPVVVKDDGGQYHSSRTQRWLWSCWLDMWARVNKDADGYRKILVINGDLGELDAKDRSAQVITVNKATILNTVREVLGSASWDDLYIIRGTRAHEGKSAWLEEEIANDLSAVPSLKLPSIFENGKEIKHGIYSWWQIRAEVEGVKFDIAHHAPMGSTPWTRVNSAVKLASSTLWHYAVERGIKPPDEVVRSHNHIRADVTVENCHASFTPGWSGMTEYGYRAGFENSLPTVGGLVFYCHHGICDHDPKGYLYVPEKERRIWAMKL